jgi:hypothetical protein
VTSTGRQAWREYVAERDRPPGDRVELDWPAAGDLLERIYDKHRDEGAPPPGVTILCFVEDPASGHQAVALVRALAHDEYLEIAWEGPSGPGLVIPQPKTVRMVDRWPAVARPTLGGADLLFDVGDSDVPRRADQSVAQLRLLFRISRPVDLGVELVQIPLIG